MSVSSSEGSPLPVDLATKYQKLAAEYAKVRAQVSVLKKAVVDEQTRSNEFKELLMIRDQTIRKHDQELDGLTFRNQQLTKRVTVLQEELEKCAETAKKSRGKTENNFTAEESKLFQEELQNRIVQNAKLISQLEEKNIEHDQEKRKWEESVKKYEKSLQESEKQCCDCDSLRTKVANLEAVVQRNVKSQKVENRIPQQVVWRELKKLPIVDVIDQTQQVLGCNVSTSQLQTAFASPSQGLILPALQGHLAKLAEFGGTQSKSNSISRQFLTLLSELETEIVNALDANLVPQQSGNVLGSIGGVAHAMRNAAVYHSQNVCLSEKNLLDSLSALEKSSESVWKAINLCEINCSQLLDSSPENTSQMPCHNCRSFFRQYDEKIQELEKRIKIKSVTVENGLVGLAATVSAINNSEISIDVPSIENEFGCGDVVRESSWLKEQLMLRSSELLSERQLAEGKLTRALSEGEATKSQLEHSLLQLQEQSALVSLLQEELSITTRNYEVQLSSMSEHMANMNDKLAAQQTMIEDLSYELSTKDNKKGRAK